ncbi:MAG: transglycosylase SLT domain-containing protein [Deltaproteobacteria bacterium]|nr:transglycosylase SLT domain-containing protein [Deltaproteobacteria bacterium]MCX7952557.1 transglycosylase SLT domain-containing protein [Deltaproteobacteria bacterium]
MLIEIAEQLDREGLSPVYLGIPVVESNLDPYAVSRDGSAGLWQLQPRTAKAFKLKVSPQLDERLCPKKSTQAAIKFIKYLKSQFGSDEFTIAGYQLGETKLRRILKRKKDLPEISRKYVLNVKNAYNKWKAVIDPLRQSQPMAG